MTSSANFPDECASFEAGAAQIASRHPSSGCSAATFSRKQGEKVRRVPQGEKERGATWSPGIPVDVLPET